MPIRPTNYKTSPSGKRIAALLGSGYTGTVTEIAQRVHCSTVTAGSALKDMTKDGAAHVRRWQRQRAGPITAVYAAGRGKTPPRPQPYSQQQKAQRYRKSLKQKLGEDLARQVLYQMSGFGNASQIVVDGSVVWRRGVGVVSTGVAA